MRFVDQLSIRRQQQLLLLITSSTALLLACAAFGTYDFLTSRRELARSVTSIADVIGRNSVAALDFNDAAHAGETLAALGAEPHIVAARIYDREGELFASFGPLEDPHVAPPALDREARQEFRSGCLHVTRTIGPRGEFAGTIYVAANLDALYARLTRYAGIAALVFILSLLVAFGLAARLERRISAPLSRLAAIVRQVARERNYGLRAPVTNHDEVGQLIAGFNDMLGEIQERDRALRGANDNLERRVEERTRELAQENQERRRAEEALLASEQRYREMAMNSSDLLYVLDLATNGLQWYGDIDQLLGYAPGEFPHNMETWEGCIHPEDRDRVMQQLTVACERGLPFQAEYRMRRKDGSWRYWSDRGKVLLHEDGRPARLVGACSDITERKQAEVAIAYERDLLHALLVSSPDAIYFKDRESRYLRCSNAMARTYGLRSVDQLTGTSTHDYLTPECADLSIADDAEVMRTGQSIVGKTERILLRNGRCGWALTSKMALRDVHGEIIGTIGISKDVTQEKENELKIDALNKQLHETSRQAGMAEVATSVLHNVGNVLNSVNVSATLIADQVRGSDLNNLAKVCALLRQHRERLGEFLTVDAKGRQLPGFLEQLADHLSAEQREMLRELETLRRNLEHMKEIVAMQQSYAKVSGVAETLPVAELVEDALRMNAGALVRHEITLVREYRAQPLVTVERHKVLQILVNVIRNAKYACDDSGRSDKEVRVRIESDDRRVQIAVIDNGVGIPPENLTRIFNHGFTTRKTGHGFGLHSGALAARELGGALLARSAGPGAGATFVLELPLTSEANAA